MPFDALQSPKQRAPLSCGDHIVYRIICTDGRIYIGITALKKTVEYSLHRRWTKHVSRANRESDNWNLCIAIRELGRDAFKIEPLHVVDTKEIAHDIERYLIDDLKPELNSDTRQWSKYKMVPAHIKNTISVDQLSFDANI